MRKLGKLAMGVMFIYLTITMAILIYTPMPAPPAWEARETLRLFQWGTFACYLANFFILMEFDYIFPRKR